MNRIDSDLLIILNKFGYHTLSDLPKLRNSIKWQNIKSNCYFNSNQLNQLLNNLFPNKTGKCISYV